LTARGKALSTLIGFLLKAKEKGVENTLKGFLITERGIVIFDPALLDLEVAIAKNVIYFPRNE
jgi:hypothetical protein